MITADEGAWLDGWGQGPDPDPRCEFCGRSMMTRFGGGQVSQECESCRDTWARVLAQTGGMVEV